METTINDIIYRLEQIEDKIARIQTEAHLFARDNSEHFSKQEDWLRVRLNNLQAEIVRELKRIKR